MRTSLFIIKTWDGKNRKGHRKLKGKGSIEAVMTIVKCELNEIWEWVLGIHDVKESLVNCKKCPFNNINSLEQRREHNNEKLPLHSINRSLFHSHDVSQMIWRKLERILVLRISTVFIMRLFTIHLSECKTLVHRGRKRYHVA